MTQNVYKINSRQVVQKVTTASIFEPTVAQAESCTISRSLNNTRLPIPSQNKVSSSRDPGNVVSEWLRKTVDRPVPEQAIRNAGPDPTQYLLSTEAYRDALLTAQTRPVAAVMILTSLHCLKPVPR